MAKKHMQVMTFSEKMTKYAKDKLSETTQMTIAKKKFLLSIEADINQVKAEGYTYPMIAEVATMEFLKSGVPKFFTAKDKEGIEVQYETKIWTLDIKNICESKNDK